MDNSFVFYIFDFRPEFFSPETQCPNENSAGSDGQCAGDVVWNENGSGLLRRDIPFPIFFLPSSRIQEIDKIIQCHDRYVEFLIGIYISLWHIYHL